MRVSINRTKTYATSTKKMNELYRKYKKRVKSWNKKGVDVEIMGKKDFEATLEFTKANNAYNGKYSSNIANQIADDQRYEGKLKRREAIAFRRALGYNEKKQAVREAQDNLTMAIEVYGYGSSEYNTAMKKLDFAKKDFGTVDLKIKDIQEQDRQMYIEAHRAELKAFADKYRNNPQAVADFNKMFGTSYDDYTDIISFYWFGSK